ncbi:ATP-grasp domain-containing protein [Virgibacillus sediminis]|uniref:RimK family alpha-L-glutamate ligase n=1 Tax=Virgibacillus sediminis TaxID=202260 RepID=A0ABV7A648_9BACI
MIKGWLIYRKEDAAANETYIEWMKEEAAWQGLLLKLIYREEITMGITEKGHGIWKNDKFLPPPEFAINRAVDPLLSFHLENMGIPVFNPSEVSRICNDKAWTHQYVQKMGVPMTDSLFYRKTDLPPAPPLNLPIVVKESGGRGGKEVYIIHTAEDWKQVRGKLADTTILVQSADVQLGKDLRVFVVGKQVTAAVLRENQHDFRANYKLGGSASLYQLTGKEMDIVQKITSHFPFGMVGIDFLIDHDGNLLFNEIEDVVGSRTLSQVNGPNIVCEYMTYIRKHMEKRHSI